MARVPVNIISGFLGTGKSTTLKHLVEGKPKGERWAVLVNEYGEVGIDRVILNDLDNDDDVIVKELPNGCICCSSGFLFKLAILVLIREHEPHRLLIEPTGLAALNSIIDTFREPGLAHVTEVRSAITLVDPVQWADPAYQQHETYRDQIDAADMLMATRCDLAESQLLDRFFNEAARLFPPKEHIGRCDHGQLPAELLDRVKPREAAVVLEGGESHCAHEHPHVHEAKDEMEQRLTAGRRTHHDDDVHACGWLFPADYLFDWGRLDEWLTGGFLPSGFVRLKGVFSTNCGWLVVNATSAQRTVSETAYRRDSRVEVLASPQVEPNWGAAEAELRSCLISENDSRILEKTKVCSNE